MNVGTVSAKFERHCSKPTAADGTFLAIHRDQLVEVLTQAFQGRQFIVTENSFPPLSFSGCVVLENFLGEGLFARKVMIEGTLGNSGKVKDFLYAGGGVPEFVD